jgi:hypothetical protein
VVAGLAPAALGDPPRLEASYQAAVTLTHRVWGVLTAAPVGFDRLFCRFAAGRV